MTAPRRHSAPVDPVALALVEALREIAERRARVRDERRRTMRIVEPTQRGDAA